MTKVSNSSQLTLLQLSIFLILGFSILSVLILFIRHHNFSIGENIPQKIGLLRKNVILLEQQVFSLQNSSNIHSSILTHKNPPNSFPEIEPKSKIKLHAVTYASHGGKDDRFCRAVESALRNEVDLVILGWGVPWRGLSQKLEAAHSYAASLSENDVILFTDAFDILYTDTSATILDNFLDLDSKIIFSAECGCWPHVMENRKACFVDYPKSPTPYRYLNSGTWIGFAPQAERMLKDVMIEAGNNFGNANDQKLIADLYIAGRYGIQLDFYNRIFQSMHMTLDPPLPRCNPVEDVQYDATEKKFRNYRTDSHPSIFHFNGGGKTVHLSMESQVWYKDPSFLQQQQAYWRERSPSSPKKSDFEIGSRLITVPTAPSGKLSFEELCGSYVSSLKN